MAVLTRIQNNQITDGTIFANAKIAAGTITGNLLAPTVTFNSNITILGNLQVANSYTQLNSVNTYINDPLVVLNNNYTGSVAGYDIGILVNRNLASLGNYGSVNTAWAWVENDQAFEAFATTDTGTGVATVNNSGYANLKVGNVVSISETVTNSVSVGTTLSVTGATTLTTATVAGLQAVALGNVSPGTGAFTTLTASSVQGIVGNATPNLAFFTTANANTVNAATVGNTGTQFTGANLTLTNTVNAAIVGNTSTQFTGANLTLTNTAIANTVNAATIGNSGAVFTGASLTTSGNISGSALFSNVGAISLQINGNTFVSNTGKFSLGTISNVQIQGGSANQYIQTDGAGNLTFVTVPIVGNVIPLGSNSSGQLISNAVSLTSSTYVTDAIAQLNAILGKLTPSSPPNFPATTLTQSTGTTTGLMASFTQTDNSGWGNLSVSGGTSTNAVRVATFATSTVTNSGTTPSGGNIQLYINGNTGNSYHSLSSSPTSADNGTYGNLVVSGVQDYHNIYSNVAAGFWNVFSAAISASSIPAGWNRANIYYTGDATGTSTLTWYYDSSSPTAPAFSGTSIALTSNTVTYSSTIPHLNSSAGFTLNGTVQNLSGDMYYSAWTSTGANFFSATGAGGALLAPANRTLAQVGVPVPLTRNNTSAYSFSTTSNVTTGFGSAVATAGPSVSVSTPYTTTSSGTFQPGNIILYKTGTGTQIEETSLTSNFGTAYRIVNPDGGTAADTPAYTGSESAFNSQTSTLLATDATVVAAKLQYDVTNYSTGYYPVGPNLSSGRSASQYFTFKFAQAAVSSFYIHYTGTLAGLWIACPGVTDTPASPTNGWLNAAAAYAGSGVPGTGTGGNGSNGCAVGGNATLNSNGTYDINVTFGSVNTSSAGNNGHEVYVRVKLTSGQSLTALTVQTS
jgi:hypothetical protein